MRRSATGEVFASVEVRFVLVSVDEVDLVRYTEELHLLVSLYTILILRGGSPK